MTQPNVATRLRARTRLIDKPESLLAHLGVDGCAWLDGDHGFVTAGVVTAVAPADAVALLASIDHNADTGVPAGAGPRAIGALPFDLGTDHGRVVVPARIVARDADGRAWCTEIHHGLAGLASHVAMPAPTRFAVASAMPIDAWRGAVRRALAAIDDGMIEKVVLARAATVDADAAFDVGTVLARLHATQPGCVVYADGGFVGASPELLVDRRGDQVRCRPLAGTGRDRAELAASEKDAREHQLVVDAVVSALRTCAHDVHAGATAPVAFADVSHLATEVCATTNATAVELVHALHPTPAVAGTPRDHAMALIAELEPTPRERYAGPFGWVDAAGDGAFVVALRGAEIDGAHAVLHAGAGIVTGSDPDAEWAETQAKFRPMLTALVAP
jgi:menaquinone-specific isochorismate synthase